MAGTILDSRRISFIVLVIAIVLGPEKIQGQLMANLCECFVINVGVGERLKGYGSVLPFL